MWSESYVVRRSSRQRTPSKKWADMEVQLYPKRNLSHTDSGDGMEPLPTQGAPKTTQSPRSIVQKASSGSENITRLNPAEQPSDGLREQPPKDDLRGQQHEDDLEGQQPEDDLIGQQPEDDLEGQQPEDDLEGQQPEDDLRGQQPEDDLTRQQPENDLIGQQLQDNIRRQQPEEDLRGQQPKDELGKQQPEDNLGRRQPKYNLRGQQPDHLRGQPEDDLGGQQPDDDIGEQRPGNDLRRLQPEDNIRGQHPENDLRGQQTEKDLRGHQPEDEVGGQQPGWGSLNKKAASEIYVVARSEVSITDKDLNAIVHAKSTTSSVRTEDSELGSGGEIPVCRENVPSPEIAMPSVNRFDTKEDQIESSSVFSTGGLSQVAKTHSARRPATSVNCFNINKTSLDPEEQGLLDEPGIPVMCGATARLVSNITPPNEIPAEVINPDMDTGEKGLVDPVVAGGGPNQALLNGAGSLQSLEHVILTGGQSIQNIISLKHSDSSINPSSMKSLLEKKQPGKLCYVMTSSASSLEAMSGEGQCSLVMTVESDVSEADSKQSQTITSASSSASFLQALESNHGAVQMSSFHMSEEQSPTGQPCSQDLLQGLQQEPASLVLETLTPEESPSGSQGPLPIKLLKLDPAAPTELSDSTSIAIGEAPVNQEVGEEGIPGSRGMSMEVLLGPLQNPAVADDGQYQCIFCPYKTDKRANWYEHKKCHSMRKYYPCKHCDYTAAKSSNLRRHMLTHVGVKEFFCTECSASFRQKSHLQRHIKYKHEEKQVKCEYCDYVCASYNPDLKTHMLRKHLLQANEEEARAKLSCAECGFVAASIRDLSQHMKFHRAGPELKLYCELCSFVTDCMSRLKRHILVHSKERPFACQQCSYRATQREHVVRHMRIKHGLKVHPVKRRQPAETSSQPCDQLLVLSVEDGDSMPGLSNDMESLPRKKKYAPVDYTQCEKKFLCSQCTMTFSKLLNLYKHLQAQHNVENPGMVDGLHSCLVCDYRTNKKANLLVHMRKHNPSHPASKEKLVYTCMMCNCFSTAKRSNLYTHMATKHNMHIMRPEGPPEPLADEDMEEKEEPMVSLLATRDTAQSDSLQQTVMVELEPGMPPSAIVIDPPPKSAIVTDSPAKSSMPAETVEAVEGLTSLSHQPPSMTAVNHQGQVMELTAGDFIEIDGEVYKVEFTSSAT